MKVPKYIKELLMRRERFATSYLSCESKLNDWLEKKGIFEKCACGEHDCLFNTGVEAMSPGSAGMTIKVLEEL